MLPLALPIIAGSIISAGAGIYGANKAAKSAERGAALNAASQEKAIEEQRRQFDLVRGDTAPYRQTGVNALDRLSALYGLGPVAGSTASNIGTGMSVFTQDPGYQFNLAEGQKAIDRSLAARGKALSGAGIKEGMRYASGLASQEFGNFYNRLANIAGLGQGGVNTSAQAGMSTASNIGNAYSNIGAGAQNAANARGSAYMTGAQAVNNAAQGGVSNYLLSEYLNTPKPAITGG